MLTIELVFECVGAREARSLEATLSPDNRGLPKDQELVVSRRGRKLFFTIKSQRSSSAVSSALSILSDAKLFQDVWRAATS